jgi:DNA-binding response OmpR family regulator
VAGAKVKLLMIEDSPRLAGVMGKLLRDGGMTVDAVGTIGDARAALAFGGYDAILLDLSLPDGDGAELLRELRRAGDATPILVATARSEVTDRVALLNAGADDYLVKPFSLNELLARIRALLRRPPQTAPRVLAAGNLSLDTQSQALTVAAVPLELPRLELRILTALLARPGQLLPRARLEQAVYSMDAEVTPNAIEAAISRLRRRLEGAGATVAITAMRGLGYVLAEARQEPG